MNCNKNSIYGIWIVGDHFSALKTQFFEVVIAKKLQFFEVVQSHVLYCLLKQSN